MKKLILGIIFSLAYVTTSSAELGFNVGVSGNGGMYGASAKESNPTTSATTGQGTEYGAAVYGSIFAEATLGDRFILGVDYVPTALETETAETEKSLKSNPASITYATNKIQIDFEHLTTFYAGIMITENFYAKVGIATVDVVTNESLGTGSSYGDTELDGTTFGLGYHNALDNGLFVRFEGNYVDFGAASQTSSTNADRKISLTSLDGVTGKLSLGKTF